jgi:uncharacterized repeat protein (TIGR01451 family)
MTQLNDDSDLAVSINDSPDPLGVGNDLTYSVTVTNNGPEPASAVTLTDTLPSGPVFVSASASHGSCGCRCSPSRAIWGR